MTVTLVLMMALMKTFFYLRVSMRFALFVALIIKVMGGLNTFILFYIIIVYMCALILGVLGYENYTWEEVHDTD